MRWGFQHAKAARTPYAHTSRYAILYFNTKETKSKYSALSAPRLSRISSQRASFPIWHQFPETIQLLCLFSQVLQGFDQLYSLLYAEVAGDWPVITGCMKRQGWYRLAASNQPSTRSRASCHIHLPWTVKSGSHTDLHNKNAFNLLAIPRVR